MRAIRFYAVFGLRVSAAAIAFGNIFLVSKLGATITGRFLLTVSIVQIAVMLCRSGLEQPLVRVVSQNEIGVVRSVLCRIGSYYLRAAGLVVAFTAVVGASLVAFGVFFHELGGGLLLVCPSVLLMVFGGTSADVLKGGGRPVLATLLSELLPNVFLCVLLWMLADVVDYEGLCVIFLLSQLLGCCLSVMVAVRTLGVGPISTAVSSDVGFGALRMEGVALLWVNLAEIGIMTLGSFVLAVTDGEAAVGVFRVVCRLGMTTSFVFFAVNAVASHEFAKIRQSGSQQEMVTAFRRYSLMAAVLALPLLCVFVFVPDAILGVFGDEFKVGASALSTIALGQFAFAVAGPLQPLLQMTENSIRLRNGYICSFVAMLAVTTVIVPYSGMLGAAMGICLARFVMVSCNARAVAAILQMPLVSPRHVLGSK